MINGRLLRLKNKVGGVYQNIDGEVSSTLTISVGYVQTTGGARGVGHKFQIKSWNIVSSFIVASDSDNLGGLWDIFATIGEAPYWRFDGGGKQYRGQAYMSNFAVSAAKGGLVQVDITLQGSGPLIKN